MTNYHIKTGPLPKSRALRVAALHVAALHVVALVLCGGCGPAITGAGADLPIGGVEVLFDPSANLLPFPNDLIGRAPDGTLNLDEPNSVNASEQNVNDPRVALSSADGFSTLGPIQIPLSGAISLESLENTDVVRVFEASLDASRNGSLTSLNRELVQGEDFTLSIARGRTLVVTPLRARKTEQGYVVCVTSALVAADGVAARPSNTFRLAIAQTSLVNAQGQSSRPRILSDDNAAALEPLRQLLSPIADALVARGVARETIAVAFAFSTRSSRPTLDALVAHAEDDLARGQLQSMVATHPAPIFTSEALNAPGAPPFFAGIVDVYAFSLAVPMFVDVDNPLEGRFESESGGHLTRFDFRPVALSHDVIPGLLSVPNEASGIARPLTGWPVVVFQHGITGDRTQFLAVAEALASAGLATVSIDLPLHGLTRDPQHPLFALEPLVGTGGDVSIYSQSPAFDNLKPRERTLELDVVDNDNGALGADGVTDSSGTHFLNLRSLMTGRDNARQAMADLSRLARAVAFIDLDGDGGGDLDGDHVSFLGHSLGAIIGATTVATDSRYTSAVLVAGGGGLMGLLLGSSTFGPIVRAQLASAGVQPGSAAFDQFTSAAQTLFDAGDPVATARFAIERAERTPLLLVEHVGGRGQPCDQVVPNFVGAFPLSGTEALARALDLDNIDSAGFTSPQGVRALWRINGGDHSSLLDPSSDLDVTIAMQRAIAIFLASGGNTTGPLDVDITALAPPLVENCGAP